MLYMKVFKFINLLLVSLLLLTGCGTVSANEIEETVVEEDPLAELAVLPVEVNDGNTLIDVALNELGYVGGDKFWSWAGFSSHAAWCACFVSWCANECGFIEDGIIPKFTMCQDAVVWFRERGLWLDKTCTPEPGMLIFFDYNHCDYANHVGIVHEVKDGYIYSIEGNSKDSVRENPYLLSYEDIMGYAIPQYMK